MSTDPIDETIDLANCDREPIHIPGLIQPHGALLGLHEDTFEIIQVSANTQAVIGYEPAALLGKPLVDLLNAEQVRLIQRCLAADFEYTNPLKLSINSADRAIELDGIVHRFDSVIILELEPKTTQHDTSFFEFYQQVRGTITRLQKASTLLEMCQIVVNEVQRLTGFERVMVY